VKLDVTLNHEVADAARICGDVTLVINNAGLHGRLIFLTRRLLKLPARNSKLISSE
jgi:hypothetical protein